MSIYYLKMIISSLIGIRNDVDSKVVFNNCSHNSLIYIFCFVLETVI